MAPSSRADFVNGLLTVLDSRIEPGVENIDDKVRYDEDQGHQHNQRLRHRVIGVLHRFHEQPAKTVQIKYLFGDHQPAHEERELDADNGHHRQHRVLEGAAARWYLKVAAAGVASAQYNIAVFYQLGKGVAPNPAEALRWHALAADQGHRRAQNNLGAMYYTGAGVARDLVEAWKWLTLAAQSLRGEAGDIVQRNIAAIEGELTPDALADAKRRVGAWKKRK